MALRISGNANAYLQLEELADSGVVPAISCGSCLQELTQTGRLLAGC